MLMSEILKEMRYCYGYSIVGEKPFEYLALIESELEQPHCVYIDNEKYIDSIKENVSMVITMDKIALLLKEKPFGLCIVDQPKALFFDIHNYISNKPYYARERFKTVIGENCNISALSSISDNNIKIGNNVKIEEFVVIKENTIIGDNTIIRAGCVVGGQGYEFKTKDFGIMSVAHVGGVKIGRHVEIQYNTCVDRGVYPWDNTVIGDYCKIDNLVHIAHGVKLDRNVMVVANVGIGGRTVIGEGTWLGFAATVINGITVGKKARANIGSVVTKSIPNNVSVTGNFAIEHSKFIHNLKKSVNDA